MGCPFLGGGGGLGEGERASYGSNVCSWLERGGELSLGMYYAGMHHWPCPWGGAAWGGGGRPFTLHHLYVNIMVCATRFSSPSFPNLLLLRHVIYKLLILEPSDYHNWESPCVRWRDFLCSRCCFLLGSSPHYIFHGAREKSADTANFLYIDCCLWGAQTSK